MVESPENICFRLIIALICQVKPNGFMTFRPKDWDKWPGPPLNICASVSVNQKEKIWIWIWMFSIYFCVRPSMNKWGEIIHEEVCVRVESSWFHLPLRQSIWRFRGYLFLVKWFAEQPGSTYTRQRLCVRCLSSLLQTPALQCTALNGQNAGKDRGWKLGPSKLQSRRTFDS